MHFLSGGGVTGQLTRSIDWAKTSLGPPESWPGSLKTTVGMLLHSRHPMFLWWGEDLIQFYNDAYLPSFGVGKHPAAMGQRGRDCWREIWPIIGPQIDDVMKRETASWNEDGLVSIFRNGRIEEVYWTYGYSPVYGDNEEVGGTLVVCTETTGRVLAERRLEVVRALAVELLGARVAGDVTRAVVGAVASAPRDIPFAILYPRNTEPVAMGLDRLSMAAVDAVARAEIHRGGRFSLPEPLAAGPWSEPVTDIFVIALATSSEQAIVFGLSSRLPFDAAYRSFLEQIVEQDASTRARVTARLESERLLARAEVGEAQFRDLVDNLPELAWHALPDGYIEFYNRRWYEYTGTTFEQMKGWGWEAVHRPDMLDGVTRRWKHSIDTGEPFEMEFPLRGADGVYRWFLTRVRPLRDAEGNIVRWFGTNTDIDERARNDEFRDVFLGILGHDLRNPLSAILNGAHLMTMRDSLPREATVTLGRILSSGKRMQRMIEQLLDMTRARIGGGIAIARSEKPQNVEHLVSKIVEEARAVHPGRNIEFHAEWAEREGGEPLARVDGDRIEQVVSNLLGNALTYGDREKPIRVDVGGRDGSVCFSVHNYGSPIAADLMSRLFNPFQRGANLRGRTEGLGLGLFIANDIVRAHGGTIEVESSSEMGTRFEVILPRRVAAGG